MFFLYIAFSCLLSLSGIQLGRRSNEISFDKKSSKSIRSNEDSWYFVYFHLPKTNPDRMISDLANQGINIKTTDSISKHLYNLYLTPDQVRYIVSNNLGEVQEIDSNNKITNEPTDRWTRLTIETYNTDSFINYYNQHLLNTESCTYTIQKRSHKTISIQSSRQCLTSLLPTLSHDKKVNSITYDSSAEELNCRATGFVQKNTDSATFSIDDNDGSNLISIDRYLNKQGLDGSNVKVLVVDTFLDTNSTYFYDPNHPTVKVNEFTNGHRKIDYISSLENAQVKNNDHGTHTAGSITGKALNDSSSAAEYNGCAPGARLSFYCDNWRDYPPEEVSKVVDTVRPHVSTNSWGLDYVDPLHDSLWDEVCFTRNDTLFVFAAGNSAVSGEFDHFDGYKSLRSPGSAKNVLTVGATQMVRVSDESINGEDRREVYMTDEEDESTHLTKILRWSLDGYDKNVGMKALFDAGRLKVLISRNPSELTNTTVLVIDKKEQFDQLSKENPPYFVMTTVEFEVNNFAQMGFKHTFPVLYLSSDKVPQYESNILESNYRSSDGYKRAEFSSKGTGNLGLMKPDIMCPGMSVMSARAYPNSQYDNKELTIKHGTSMATPICAGAAAIVIQYFMEGKYRNKRVNISSYLARSFLITCSDPLSDHFYPNCEDGHGLLNLGKYIGNGFDTDNSHFLIGDRLKIIEGGSTHLMANVAVLDTKTELRVTLSYLDAVLSADSSAALAVDIDLVVVSPSGKVYRGNMREDGTEEHYSTNERVIVKEGEVEKGNYEVHVFSAVPSTLQNLTNKVEFAVTVYGSLDNSKNGDFLTFSKANKCIPVENGDCNEETFDNDCYNLYFGRSCQTQSIQQSIYVQRNIVKVKPYGLQYVTFYYPGPDEPADVTYRVTPVTQFEPKIFAFYEKVKTGGLEFEADLISVRNGFSASYKYDPNNLPSVEEFMLAVIYNTSPYPTEFVITSDVELVSKPPTENWPGFETDTPPDVSTSHQTETVHITSPTDMVTSQSDVVTSPTAVVTSPSSAVTEPAKDNVSSDSSKNWKLIAIISSAISIAFALVSISLVIYLIVVIMKRRNYNEKSESMAAIHSTLLA